MQRPVNITGRLNPGTRVDPICHTLVGGCLARTGLARRTAFGTATLLVAANLPDVDVLAIPFGRNLEWRRGWTHGVLALAVWPWVLATVMWGLGRLRPAGAEAVRFRALVGLAAIGVATHPFLDFLNTYGMRWLMPFRDRWYYGDTLFIVDPWLWAVLALAIWASGRARRRGAGDPGRPARVALGLAAAYIGVMMLTTLRVRAAVREEVGPLRIMAAPVPLRPLTRQVVVEEGDRYRIGRYRIGSADPLRLEGVVRRGGSPEAAAAVAAAPGGLPFLRWARFPAWTLEPQGDSVRIRVRDLRYAPAEGESWAAYEVVVPRTALVPSGAGPPDGG
jgi:inner membrane protein